MRAYFRADSRGVSEVVGAVLLLGFLILLLSIYQVAVVPNQNAATEFEHNQQVEDELVDVRNAVLEARSSGKDTFASVTLGTRYQSRVLAINPPSPTGTLQTVEQPNVSVIERGGDTDPLRLAERPLENQFIEYTPRYYEYQQAGTMRYENTVAYHEYAEANVFMTDQTLVRGDTVSLIPLEGTFRENGMQRVAVEPTPGIIETVRVDDPEIVVPTELTQDNWVRLLDGEVEESNIDVTNGNLTLTLEGVYDVAYAPVGINRLPTEGERTSDTNEINPAAPGDVSLERVTTSQQTFTLQFNNTAGTTNFTRARINFYNNDGGQAPSEAELFAAGDPTVRATLTITEDYEDISPPLTVTGQDTTNIELTFDGTGNLRGDWFVITIVFESGQRGQYFVTRSG